MQAYSTYLLPVKTKIPSGFETDKGMRAPSRLLTGSGGCGTVAGPGVGACQRGCAGCGRKQGAMRRLAAGVLCVGVLVGCGGMPPGSRPPQEARRLGVDFDQAWDTLIR